MANSDQKPILLEQAYDELKAICIKFQDESGATDMEVKTLLRELARVYEKDICLLYTSPSPRDMRRSRMPSSA